MKELILKKCSKCGATIKVINDCTCDNCGIKCCGEEMQVIKANDSIGSVEKHKPVYTYEGNKLVVNVNHVMEEEHYIEWICLLTENKEEYIYFREGDTPTTTFNKETKGNIYSYCNKHGLWVTEIKD